MPRRSPASTGRAVWRVHDRRPRPRVAQVYRGWWVRVTRRVRESLPERDVSTHERRHEVSAGVFDFLDTLPVHPLCRLTLGLRRLVVPMLRLLHPAREIQRLIQPPMKSGPLRQ